ncbi:unnamed protein product [Rotaria socialis]|uniref:CRAL-TRIO domain-containing protein n=1 Tax=Rotaria socialis TaxID=392032 RepID=A0A820QME7_9BILA|nr:unnamed protein product [Rotaria socialis]CAF3388557.1 unnamed protein product [Rotaria socialis]CAF3555695.1 unnamed protein product [Rotaria socialis]CAF3598214.1 unnamed protein product [Rotaria socialis]CAF3627431.1 unnamed protein product [Rotaria socialis]
MSADDPGHIKNLDKSQIENLKKFWGILRDYMNDSTNKINSIYQDELFLAIGYDNPDTVLLRWLRARKWDIHAALQQLNDTINWRHQWGVKELLDKGETDLFYDEILTGKTYFMGKDRAGRPIDYVYAKEHVKDQFPSEATEKLTVFSMETGRKLLESPNESVTVIFDLNGFGLKNMDYQHLKFLINLLQNYYPESFSLGLIINAPWIFNGCWYIIKRWLDPVVESKIHFLNNINDLTKFIDPSVLPKRLNGSQSDFNYIPPTDKDLLILNTIRNDQQGKVIVEQAHREAVKSYLNITYQWINEEDTNNVLEKRKIATQKLRDAFEQLVPYIHTKTHYHRIGLINEPIFDITYQTIINNNKQQ